MSKQGICRFLFLIICITDLVASAVGLDSLHIILKPLIMISLAAYYVSATKSLQAFFVIALLVSLAGDVFLLYELQSDTFFLLGLAAFLTAHIFYIIIYRRNRGAATNDPLIRIQILRISFPVILSGIALAFFLYPKLGSLALPVVIYAAVMVVMVLSALSRMGRTSSQSFWMVFAGAVSFMISDALVAIDKFSHHFAQANTAVMLTYCLAQYLITEGILLDEKGGNSR